MLREGGKKSFYRITRAPADFQSIVSNSVKVQELKDKVCLPSNRKLNNTSVVVYDVHDPRDSVIPVEAAVQMYLFCDQHVPYLELGRLGEQGIVGLECPVN